MAEDDTPPLALLLGVALLLVATFAVVQPVLSEDTHERPEELTEDDVRIVEVSDNSSTKLWPYTSRGKSFHTSTLPINLVVKGNESRLRYVLEEETYVEWNNTTAEWETAEVTDSRIEINESGVNWGQTTGAVRYTYMTTGDGEGRWVRESYQLHDGTYLGSRYHIRVYGSKGGADSWVAIQAHQEHWDWFRLRHTVSGLGGAQKYIEDQFVDRPFVEEVRKERYDNGGKLDSNGWVTVVDLDDEGSLPDGFAVSAVGALLSTGYWSRRELATAARELAVEIRHASRYGLVAASLIAIVLVVRVGAVGLEGLLPMLNPKIIAAPFYLLLAFGLPAAAYRLSRGLDPEDAATSAMAGLGVGFIADYIYLGIQIVPVGVLVHRVFVVIAIGFVAMGGTVSGYRRLRRNKFALLGLALWILGLVWQLLDVRVVTV